MHQHGFLVAHHWRQLINEKCGIKAGKRQFLPTIRAKGKREEGKREKKNGERERKRITYTRLIGRCGTCMQLDRQQAHVYVCIYIVFTQIEQPHGRKRISFGLYRKREQEISLLLELPLFNFAWDLEKRSMENMVLFFIHIIFIVYFLNRCRRIIYIPMLAPSVEMLCVLRNFFLRVRVCLTNTI